MRRKETDPPHVVRVLDLRERLIELRAEMQHPQSEALDTAAGAATCIICYLADHIETLRRWHDEQSPKRMAASNPAANAAPAVGSARHGSRRSDVHHLLSGRSHRDVEAVARRAIAETHGRVEPGGKRSPADDAELPDDQILRRIRVLAKVKTDGATAQMPHTEWIAVQAHIAVLKAALAVALPIVKEVAQLFADAKSADCDRIASMVGSRFDKRVCNAWDKLGALDLSLDDAVVASPGASPVSTPATGIEAIGDGLAQVYQDVGAMAPEIRDAARWQLVMDHLMEMMRRCDALVAATKVLDCVGRMIDPGDVVVQHGYRDAEQNSHEKRWRAVKYSHGHLVIAAMDDPGDIELIGTVGLPLGNYQVVVS